MKTTITLAILTICVSSFAQDMITYRNGTEVTAKVIEVTSTEVKFKRADNPDGPTYSISKSDLHRITYENGISEVFTQGSEPSPQSQHASLAKPDEEEGFSRLDYNGPRVGLTIIGPGKAREKLQDLNRSPVITQFGWQFETRMFTLDNGSQGLLEWVLLVGGIEQGLFLPSASMLLGYRGHDGYEFGLGPNLSLTGAGMVFAFGGSIQSGKINFPINLSVVPSVSRNDTEYNSYTGNFNSVRNRTGVRVSLTVGFNTKTRSH